MSMAKAESGKPKADGREGSGSSMVLNSMNPSNTSAALWRCLGAGVLLAVCLLSVGGCAGYQIGNQCLYPEQVHTVYVPMFESNSFRRNLGERLTEAVMKEIERVTPYKVVGSSAEADSILSGRITGERKRVLVEDRFDDPREVEVNFNVRVRWIDRRGRSLCDDAAIPLDQAVTDLGGHASFVPEVGQSVATAQQQAIERIAAQIVSMMEKPW